MDRDGSIDRNGDSRHGDGSRRWTGVWYVIVLKLEGRRVVSGESWSEPKIVIQLDAKWFAEWVRKGCMAVIEVSEVRSVDRGTGQQSGREW